MGRGGWVLLAALTVLAGCTRVNVFGQAPRDQPVRADAPVLARYALEYTSTALEQTNADERFNPENLREAITAELRSRGLLDTQQTEGVRAAVIQLEKFEVRGASNVVMFGRLSSVGSIDALVRIREGGAQTREFRVSTELSLQVSRDPEENNPLKRLYEEFALEFVDALTGVSARGE